MWGWIDALRQTLAYGRWFVYVSPPAHAVLQLARMRVRMNRISAIELAFRDDHDLAEKTESLHFFRLKPSDSNMSPVESKMIWRFPDLPKRGFPSYVRGAQSSTGRDNGLPLQPNLHGYSRCPFCECSFAILTDHKIWNESDGKRGWWKGIHVCERCGWWRANCHEDLTNPGYEIHDHRQGWGSLRELNLPEIDVPVAALWATARASQEIDLQVIDAWIEEAYRPLEYRRVTTAASPVPGVFSVLTNERNTIGIWLERARGELMIQPIASIAAPWLREDGSVAGIFVQPVLSSAQSEWTYRKLELLDAEALLTTLHLARRGPMYANLEAFEAENNLSSLPLRYHDLST